MLVPIWLVDEEGSVLIRVRAPHGSRCAGSYREPDSIPLEDGQADNSSYTFWTVDYPCSLLTVMLNVARTSVHVDIL